MVVSEASCRPAIMVFSSTLQFQRTSPPAAALLVLAGVVGAASRTKPIIRTQQTSNTAAANMNMQVLLLQPAAFVVLCWCANKRCLRDPQIPQAAAGRPKPAARGLGARKFACCAELRLQLHLSARTEHTGTANTSDSTGGGRAAEAGEINQTTNNTTNDTATGSDGAPSAGTRAVLPECAIMQLPAHGVRKCAGE